MIDEKLLIEIMQWKMREAGISDWNRCLDEVERFIREFPQVGGWIPVSEKLPEENEVYLVTWIDERNIPYIELVEYYPDTKSWQGIIQAGRGYEILAWQPLPPAYKER